MGRKRFKRIGTGSFFGDFVYREVIPLDHFLVTLKELIPGDRFTQQWIRTTGVERRWDGHPTIRR